MKGGECFEETAPDCPGCFAGTFLVDFFEFRGAMTGQEDTLSDAGGESITCGISEVRDGKDLKVESAVVQFLDVGRGEIGACGSGVHYVVVSLPLEGLDGEVGDLEGAIDAAQEFSDLGDPETLQMRGREEWVFENWSAKARVVLKLVQSDE
jgi:hypothetical protein